MKEFLTTTEKSAIGDWLNPRNYKGAKALWFMDAISDIQEIDPGKHDQIDLNALEVFWNQGYTPFEAAEEYIFDYDARFAGHKESL